MGRQCILTKAAPTTTPPTTTAPPEATTTVPPATTTTEPTTTVPPATTTTEPTTTTTTTTTAPPERVQIVGFAGGSRTGPGTMTATFTVTPADATCRALLLGRTANRASISPRTGSRRTVTVTAAAIDDINVYVYCTHATLKRSIEKAVFTVLDPACIQDITFRQDVTTGTQTATLEEEQWTTCKSSRRGNQGTPHYARHYKFSLTAAAQVTASVSSDQAIDVYLLSDPHPDDTDPHASGTTQASAQLTTQASAQLPVGHYIIEVARVKPRRADGDFTLTVSATATTPPTTTTVPDTDECTVTGLGALSVVGRAQATRSAAWSQDSSCVSQNRPATTYAEYFTFTLATESIITIDLASKHNTYLYLLDGHDNKQGYRQDDDDIGGPLNDRNSRLYGRLVAGEYTIEATTYKEDIVGDFDLRIELTTGGFCPAPSDDSSS